MKNKIDPAKMSRYLENEMDNTEKEMINKIIHDDEHSRKEFEKYLEVWESSANVKDFDKIDVEKDWTQVRSRMNFKHTRKPIPMRNYFLRIAAILILALGLAFFFQQLLHKTGKTQMEYYQTAATDNTKEVGFPDGTTVILNKNSRIIRNSDYGKTNRDVILDGEGFFHVAKNPDLPFRVYSLKSTVEVLGTSFNVNATNNKVVVGVVTGHVAFYETGNNKNGVDLTPNHTGIYQTKTNSFTSKDGMNMASLIWKEGNTEYHKVPAKEVLQVLAQRYNKKLKIDNKINDVVNINLNQPSLQESIQVLSFILPKLEIKEEGDNIVVVHR